MGVKKLRQNLARLIKNGFSPGTPAAIVAWGTYAKQKTLTGTLSTLPALAARASIGAPAVVVVGETVRLRHSLQWFEKRPLFGKKIVVAAVEPHAVELCRTLGEWGAQAWPFPTLEIKPPSSWAAFDRALAASYDWILFTSSHAVESFFRRFSALKKDIRQLGTAKLAAVGPNTARLLNERGLQVSLQPEVFTSDALADALIRQNVEGARILFPRAAQAREHIVRVLTQAGAHLKVVSVYRAQKKRWTKVWIDNAFEQGLPNLLVFSSAAGVRTFYSNLKRTAFWKKIIEIPSIVIGPVTQAAALQAGLHVVEMPKHYHFEGLSQAIFSFFTRESKNYFQVTSHFDI